MSIGLIFNSISSAIHGFIGWFIPLVYSAGVYVYDMKHFPGYTINIYTPIPTDTQLYVEDIQLDVKYIRDRNGAILGYIGSDGLIDYTNYVAHVSLEGTIVVWTADFDPYGIACVVVPMNTKLIHVMIDGEDLDVIPQPESAQRFTSTDTRWQSTDVPGHWFIERPRVSIDVKYNRADNYPYVDTTYHAQVVSRYDEKWYMPKFVTRGVTIDTFRLRPPQITSSEFEAQLNLCSLYISWILHKNTHEPLKLNNFRRQSVMD